MNSPLPKVYRKKSVIHRYGVYANEIIRKGQPIVQYRGRKLTKSQADKSSSDYIFILNKRYDVLGQNIARYINHSCDPNCEAVIVGNTEVWIEAIRKIKPHEELTYNYGYVLDDEEPVVCNCKKSKCVGVILDSEYW